MYKFKNHLESSNTFKVRIQQAEVQRQYEGLGTDSKPQLMFDIKKLDGFNL